MSENNTYEIEILVRRRDSFEAWNAADVFWRTMDYERQRRKCTDVTLKRSMSECDNKNPITDVRVIMEIGKCSKIVPYIFMMKFGYSNSTTKKNQFNHYEITIRHNTLESMIATREQVHDQLVGMDEYIDSGIVLSEDADKKEIYLLIGAETNWRPRIVFTGEDINH